MSITESMALLVLQIGVILVTVRLGGRLATKIGVPSVMGQLLVGVLIGPYALGSIALPGFSQGLFPLGETEALVISAELYSFATVASVILLFALGLETDLGLFLRYSVAGGVIGIGGAAASFAAGSYCGMLLLHTSFMDPRCLFLGVLSTATSIGITAQTFSAQKKMDSPEGVATLAAAVFDDMLGIVMLAVMLGVVALINGQAEGGLSSLALLSITGKAFGIWLGFTALGLVFSKQIAFFLKIFKHSYGFSILALGIAFILSGFFEKQGLAMIIGAYIIGLSLSKTDIAAIVRERIHGLYEFFIPLFFAVMGMMVNVRGLLSSSALLFGGAYTLAAIIAKVAGCGIPSLLLGFNVKGALRIGTGMVPRGEVALIIAGIGLASGVLDNQLFSIIVLMTLVTTLLAPLLLNGALNIPGQGTRKKAPDEESAREVWEFGTPEIAGLVIDALLKDLRAEGFSVQLMNIDEGLSQARMNDVSLSIIEEESTVTVETIKSDMPFVKNAIYESILYLSNTIQKLKGQAYPQAARCVGEDVLSCIESGIVSMNLKGETKEAVIAELVDMLAAAGKLLNGALVLADVLEREKLISTGMENGIALPHGKTGGIADISVAIGIKRDGINFDSMDGKPSRLFILMVFPKNAGGFQVQFLAALGAVLRNETVREAVINAPNADEVVKLLRKTER